MVLTPLALTGCLSPSARLTRRLLRSEQPQPTEAPVGPQLSTKQYIGLTKEENLYFNRVRQWNEILFEALTSIHNLEKVERAVQLYAKAQTVELRRGNVVVPDSFSVADVLIGQGVSKMKTGAHNVMRFGPTHKGEVLEGAKLYAKGIREANAIFTRLTKSGQH